MAYRQVPSLVKPQAHCRTKCRKRGPSRAASPRLRAFTMFSSGCGSIRHFGRSVGRPAIKFPQPNACGNEPVLAHPPLRMSLRETLVGDSITPGLTRLLLLRSESSAVPTNRPKAAANLAVLPDVYLSLPPASQGTQTNRTVVALDRAKHPSDICGIVSICSCWGEHGSP